MSDWVKTAKVGDRVVCVDDQFPGNSFYAQTNTPAKGQTYTIRGIFPVFHEDKEHICLRLMEIVNPERDYEIGVVEPGFLVRRFRPVEPRKTDISVLTVLLSSAPAELEGV